MATFNETVMTMVQINELEKYFHQNINPDNKQRELLARYIRLTPDQVKKWFQNRRYLMKCAERAAGLEEKNEQSQESAGAPTQAQIDMLEKVFKINKRPSLDDRERLGRNIGLTAYQILIWFQNRRAKRAANKEQSKK